MARVAAARGGGQPRAGADHVRHRRRAAPDRMGGAVAAGIRGLRAGAHRQCRPWSAAARRLRRGDGRAASGAAQRARGERSGWALQQALLAHLERVWTEPDEGIWEVRGGRRHFTYSKVMAWVAFDRAIKSARAVRLAGPVDRWRDRAAIHADVCRRGFDPELGSFVQSYGGKELDASLLLLPQVGFLPPTIRACAGRSRRSSAGCWSMAWCCATTRPPPMTACRRARAPSWPAASGWSTPMSAGRWRRRTTPVRAAARACATTSDC